METEVVNYFGSSVSQWSSQPSRVEYLTAAVSATCNRRSIGIRTVCCSVVHLSFSLLGHESGSNPEYEYGHQHQPATSTALLYYRRSPG